MSREMIVSEFGGQILPAPTPEEKLESIKNHLQYVKIASLATEEGRVSEATLKMIRDKIDSLIDDYQYGRTKR